MQFTNVTPAAILAHLVATYGQIQARDLERNLINIAKPWNPDTDIETVFNHGALCRELATEGGNPITDASYILILVKIFRDRGVFAMEIREWSHLPEADKTVARCMTFFTEAYENRIKESLQIVLTANAAIPPTVTTATSTPAPTLGGLWDYCHTHGPCQHNSMTCRAPAFNHRQDATLDQPMGGSAQIQFPGQLFGPQRRTGGRQRRNDKTNTSSASTVTTAHPTQVSSLTKE